MYSISKLISETENKLFITVNNKKIPLEDFEKNTLIFGGTGSGKTKALLIPVLDGLIKLALPGIIVDVKNNFTNDVYKIAKTHNRQDDIIEIGNHKGSDNVNIINKLPHDVFMHVMKTYLLKGVADKDKSWINRGIEILYDVSKMYFILHEKGFLPVPTLNLIHMLITDKQLAGNLLAVFETNKKLYPIEYREIVHKIESNFFHLCDLSGLRDFADETSLDTLNQQLAWTLGPVAEKLSYFSLPENVQKFSNFENKDFSLDFDDMFYNNNKIIILRFKESANSILTDLITTFIAVKSKEDISLSKRNKYSFKMVDEYQNNIMAETDAAWLDKSREFKNLQFHATQSISALLSTTSNRDAVYTIIDNCKNKFFLNSNDIETMNYYSMITLMDTPEYKHLKFLKGNGDTRECVYNNGNEEELLNLNFVHYKLLSTNDDFEKDTKNMEDTKFFDMKLEVYSDILFTLREEMDEKPKVVSTDFEVGSSTDLDEKKDTIRKFLEENKDTESLQYLKETTSSGTHIKEKQVEPENSKDSEGGKGN